MGETQSRESLDAEHDWSGVDAVEGFDMGECMLQLTEWAGVQEEDHIDELGIRVGWIDRRMSAGDSDSMVGKDPGDFCDDARSVCHVKSDIIRGRCIADWDESAGRAVVLNVCNKQLIQSCLTNQGVPAAGPAHPSGYALPTNAS